MILLKLHTRKNIQYMKKLKRYLNTILFYFKHLNRIYDFISFWKIIQSSSLFNAEYYLNTYPDVKKNNIPPLWHFHEFGWKELRNPSSEFDTQFYLSRYPDVSEASINPLSHYLHYGIKEGRIVNNDQVNIGILRNGGIFDEYFYLEMNPDVQSCGMDPATHFYYFGAKEGRAPCPNFNSNYYS